MNFCVTWRFSWIVGFSRNDRLNHALKPVNPGNGVNSLNPVNTRIGVKIPGFGVKMPYSPSKVKYILYFCQKHPTERRDLIHGNGDFTGKWWFYRKCSDFLGCHNALLSKFLNLLANSSWTTLLVPELTVFGPLFDHFSTTFRDISWKYGIFTTFRPFWTYRLRGWSKQQGSDVSEHGKMGKTVIISRPKGAIPEVSQCG